MSIRKLFWTTMVQEKEKWWRSWVCTIWQTRNIYNPAVNGKPGPKVFSICIWAVWVDHKSFRTMSKTMLNNYSQWSFIKVEIKDEVGITGKKLKVSLKTLSGEKSTICMYIFCVRKSMFAYMLCTLPFSAWQNYIHAPLYLICTL